MGAGLWPRRAAPGRATEAGGQVTFRIPVRADATFDGIAEWNFSVRYELDADGISTRTTRGHVLIANNRASAKDKRVHRSARRPGLHGG